MKRAVMVGYSPLLVLLAASLAAAGGVRTTRDSPIIIHGHVQQPGTLDSSRITSPQVSLPKLPCPEPYRLEPKPSPGFGPVWVPASPCWNGSRIVEVPGHWVW
jgi:hypothetical protein